MSSARQRLWTILAVGSLLVALLVSYVTRSQVDHMQYLDPSLLGGIERYEQVLKSPPVFAAYRTTGGAEELAGYVTLGTAPGYAGPVLTRSLFSPEGKVIGVAVMANTETPGYIQAVLNSDFLRRFEGRKLSDPLTLGKDLDGVTKATISSRAIAEGVRQAGHALGRQQFGLDMPEPVVPITVGLKELVLTVMLVLAVVGSQFNIKPLRPAVQIGSILFVGFWFNSTISLTNIGSLLMGFVPPWRQNLWWYIWVLGIPLITLVRGTSINCTWLCPFGATQELLAKVGGGQVRCRPQHEAKLRKVRYLLAWMALMIAFALGSPGIATFEPFGTLFGFQGLVIQWITLVVVLITALFVRKFWCNYFCPVSVFDELTWKLGRRMRKLFKPKARSAVEPKGGEMQA